MFNHLSALFVITMAALAAVANARRGEDRGDRGYPCDGRGRLRCCDPDSYDVRDIILCSLNTIYNYFH